MNLNGFRQHFDRISSGFLSVSRQASRQDIGRQGGRQAGRDLEAKCGQKLKHSSKSRFGPVAASALPRRCPSAGNAEGAKAILSGIRQIHQSSYLELSVVGLTRRRSGRGRPYRGSRADHGRPQSENQQASLQKIGRNSAGKSAGHQQNFD